MKFITKRLAEVQTRKGEPCKKILCYSAPWTHSWNCSMSALRTFFNRQKQWVNVDSLNTLIFYGDTVAKSVALWAPNQASRIRVHVVTLQPWRNILERSIPSKTLRPTQPFPPSFVPHGCCGSMERVLPCTSKSMAYRFHYLPCHCTATLDKLLACHCSRIWFVYQTKEWQLACNKINQH